MGETVAKEAHSWKMTEIIPQKTEELKEGFSYSSRPRPLQARRKYRNEPGQAEGYRNLMFDRRIVRGNTYAREDVLPVTAQEHPVDLQRKAEKRRAREARKRQSELEHRTKSPPPVDGRRHQPVQTELYLEEITDKLKKVKPSVRQMHGWTVPQHPSSSQLKLEQMYPHRYFQEIFLTLIVMSSLFWKLLLEKLWSKVCLKSWRKKNWK